MQVMVVYVVPCKYSVYNIVMYANCYVCVFVHLCVCFLKFLDELNIKYSHSSGPGGQSVNKGTQSCLTLSFLHPLCHVLKIKCHTKPITATGQLHRLVTCKQS